MTTAAMSKGFFEFVKSIGEAKSKQEEDRIIENELHVLKAKMAGRNVANRQMREYLIRMVYVEMLGHDASFGHIHGVKLTRARKLVDKRVGYMACSLCLHKDHELMLLLVGGLQTDLQSQNQLEVATALIVACKLINEDAIPALLPLVLKLLGHNEASIRKKAIMTIQRFYELNASCITDVPEKAKRMLCDKDPSVMAASLHLLCDLIENDVNSYKDLVSSFVSILKQIIEHRLPKDYDYHRMPAPWAQIKLLQILSSLGTADKSASEGMYEVLHEVMRRADIGINVGYAIIYECVRTVTTIFPNPHLLAEAAKCTSRFITSENHNLKYLGINALASIVQVQPQAANEHQMVVIDCLEDKDETLRRKTLDLLYRMTNEHNVNVICAKLIASLKDSVDVYLRQELIDKITSLAEKFAPDTIWFIETMSEVFEMGADLVKPQFAHNFIAQLADGIQSNMEDDESEEDIAQYAADFFFELLDKNRIPNILLKVIAWVLGEYGQYATGHSVHDEEDADENKEPDIDVMTVIRRLWEVIEKQGEDGETRQWAMSATCKLCRHLDNVPPEVAEIVNKYTASVNSELQQLSHELIELTKDRETMDTIFDKARITDAIRVDPDLKFLNKFVQKQIAAGAREYDPPKPDESGAYGQAVHQQSSGIMMEHRNVSEQDSLVQMKPVSDRQSGAGLGPAFGQSGVNDYGGSNIGGNDAAEEIDTSSGLRINARASVWGPTGYNDGTSPPQQDDANNNNQNNDFNNEPKITTISHENNSARRVEREQTPPAHQAHGNQGAPSRMEHQKTEKELMAQALFTGQGAGAALFGADKRNKRVKSRRKIPKKKASTSTRKSVSSVTSNVSNNTQNANNTDDSKENEDAAADLLDFGVSDSNTQAPTGLGSNAAAPSGGGGDDLFDLLDNIQMEPQTASNAAPQTVGMGDPMTDLFSDLGNSTQVQTNNNNNNNNNSGGMGDFDLFGALGGGSINNNNNNMNNNVANNSGPGLASLMNAASVSRGYNADNLKSCRLKLAAFPKSHDSDQPITSDSTLQLSYLFAYKQQQTTLCIFLSNLTGSTISNITVGTKSDGNIQSSFDFANSEPKPNARNVYTGIISSLNGNETACQMVNIGAANPTNMVLPTRVNIFVEYTNGKLNGQVEIKSKDLLRPQMMNTQQFGDYWLKLNGGEMKFQVKGAINNVNDYVNLLTKMQFHHIQTINTECIAAGQISSVANANISVPCLVHANCQGGAFTVSVRTLAPKISQAIANDIRIAMS